MALAPGTLSPLANLRKCLKESTKNRAFYVLPFQGVICNPIIYPRRCHWARYV